MRNQSAEEREQQEKILKQHQKEVNRQRYLEDQKKRLNEFRALENSSPTGEMSHADQSDRDQFVTEDPMRVRGSFYLAKQGEPFGQKVKQQQNSKSPRQKKSQQNRLGFPKKKAKLKLAPLGPRNVGVN